MKMMCVKVTCAKTPRTSYSMYLWATARGGAIMSLIVWGFRERALAGKGPIGERLQLWLATCSHFHLLPFSELLVFWTPDTKKKTKRARPPKTLLHKTVKR